jgi:hypothetical protein
MQYYIKYDESGKEIERKPVGRGRHPLGFYKTDEDGTVLADPPVSKTGQSQSKAGPKSSLVRLPDGYEALFAKFDDNGVMIDNRSAKGRPPQGWKRVIVDADGDIVDPVTLEPLSTEPSPVVPVAEPARVVEPVAAVSQGEEGSTVTVAPIVEGSPVVIESAIERHMPSDIETIIASKHTTIEDLKKHLSYSRIEDEDDHVSFIACDIDDGTDGDVIVGMLDWVQHGMILTRIQVDKKTGDVRIWKESSQSPGVHIKGSVNVPAIT